jgi:hypothetical protein
MRRLRLDMVSLNVSNTTSSWHAKTSASVTQLRAEESFDFPRPSLLVFPTKQARTVSSLKNDQLLKVVHPTGVLFSIESHISGVK